MSIAIRCKMCYPKLVNPFLTSVSCRPFRLSQSSLLSASIFKPGKHQCCDFKCHKISINELTHNISRSLCWYGFYETVPAGVDKIGKVIAPVPKTNTLGKLLQPFVASSSVPVVYSPLKHPFATPKRVVSFR